MMKFRLLKADFAISLTVFHDPIGELFYKGRRIPVIGKSDEVRVVLLHRPIIKYNKSMAGCKTKVYRRMLRLPPYPLDLFRGKLAKI